MQDLQGFFSVDDVSILQTIINLFIGLLLGFILKFHFEKFSSTLSGKRELARVLPFLVLIVCLIISIVKSSLALSLGLVGALSIVRFRTPIKEPEELVYLFMAIAIGLGLGANQFTLTIIATISILSAMALLRWKFYQENAKALYLMVEYNGNSVEYTPENISNVISGFVNKCDLKKMDMNSEGFQLTFIIDVFSSEKAFELIRELKNEFPICNVSLIDQNRIPGV
jgi:uncharacterized membrane protein YedE/YeeE